VNNTETKKGSIVK